MLSHVKAFLKQRKFYFRIIFTTITILGVVLIIFGFVMAERIRGTVYKELISTNEMYLQQKVDSMDINFDQIDNNLQQLIFDPVFDEYINFSRGDYFENIRSDFKESEMPFLYKYINLKKEIKSKLKFFKLSHEFVDSIYYYDIKKNIIFTDKEDQYKYPDFYDKSWKELFDSKKMAARICINSRNIIDDNNQYKNVVTFIYPLINQDNQNLFIVNIDASLFYKKFIKMPNMDDQSEIFVTSNNKIILHENKSIIGKDINDVIHFENKTEGKYNGYEMLIQYNKYNTLDWTFIYAVNIDSFQKIYGYIYSIILITLVSFIFIGSLAIIYFSSIIYKPIHKLVDRIEQNNANSNYETDAIGDKGEIGLINSTLNSTYMENDRLKKSIDKSMPFYRFTFMYSLLSDNIMEMNIEQLQWQKEFLNIDIDLNNLILIYWEICSDNDLINSYEEDQLKLTNIFSKLEDHIRQIFGDNKNISIEISLTKKVYFMNCEKNGINDILNMLETIKKNLETEIGFECNLIVSEFCEDTKDISSAYEEIQNIAWRDKFNNNNEMKYLGDLSYYSKNSIDYPKDIECELLGYIKSGDSQEAEKAFLKFMKHITLKNNNISQSFFRMILLRLLSALLNVVSDYEVDIKDIINNENDFYKVILKGELEAVWVCKNFIIKLTDLLNKKILINKNNHITKILNIIESRYNEDIYLGEIAEQLNLSEAYVSRFFKEKTGKTFKEYLTWYRIEKAKELLTLTGKSINEVAKEVGYLNNNYFIKVFKGMTGITPGDFRKGFKEMNAG